MSTLPERNGIVTERDFQKVSLTGGLSLKGDKASIVSVWNEGVQYHPRTISGIFGVPLKQGFDLEISNTKETSLLFDLFSDGKEDKFARLYDVASKELKNYEVTLTSAQQGNGLGTSFSKLGMDLDIALGLHKKYFMASSDVGGYVWARVGMELDTRNLPANNEDHEYLSEVILEKLDVLKKHLPPELCNECCQLALLENSDDLCHLANMDFDLKNTFKSKDMPARIQSNMDDLAKFCDDRGKSITLGKVLLLGEYWHGVVDYDNDVQMKRILSHLGELDHSVWVPKNTGEIQVASTIPQYGVR